MTDSTNLTIAVNSDTDLEVVETEFSKEVSFVKKELLDTLNYVEGQLADIEEKTHTYTRFSRNIFETKKLFVEQKLNLLKQLSGLAIDKKKYVKEGDDSMPNISDILNSTGK